MIIVDCTQNTEEWQIARLGIPTASEFSKIFTGGGKPSTQAGEYMNKLLAEWAAGMPLEKWSGNEWTERGHELEVEARAFYEMKKDVDIAQVGFVTTDDGLAGCSPDGLVDEDGGTEIKCPAPGTQIKYLLDDKLPNTYVPQVQGTLWVTERDWFDFVSYHPVLTSLIIRVERDEMYIAKLAEAIRKFNVRMLEKREQLKQRGYAA